MGQIHDQSSASGALLICGEPGVGKTSLLEHARITSKARVTLSVRGIEMEAGIPYVGRQDLLGRSLISSTGFPVGSGPRWQGCWPPLDSDAAQE